MAKHKLSKDELFELQYEGTMRLVTGIVLHVLDGISISDKWVRKDIGLKTLLEKRIRIRELGKWMKGWQWDVWITLYSEDNNYSSFLIKRRFEKIRKISMKYVNIRIKAKKLKPRVKWKGPSDKWIVPLKLDVKKQRRIIKKQLKNE